MVTPLVLWLAQGFGLGRIPVAPGTFGSLGGILWFLWLVQWGHPEVYFAGVVGGIALAVWACGAAERILGQRDPGSVVLDEIVAMPIVYAPWVLSLWSQLGTWPALERFIFNRQWIVTAVLFVLFRAFDILKPWPVRQSQRLPAGWGVTMDDVLAALYVAALSLIAVA